MQDKPAISYYDVTNRDLKYTYYNGNRWKTETVDSIGDVGRYTSLAFNSTDEVAISYYDSTEMTLKYATVLKPGFLSVNSSIPDAIIYVDEAKQAIQTNTTLVLEVGTYNITVVKDFYETPAYQMVTINGSNPAIEFSMVPILPEADYTTNTTSGIAPLNVAFTDQSTDGPTMWNLSFGDGQWCNTTDESAVSTTHEYTNSGIYTATLTVSARGLSNSTSTTITVNSPPSPIPSNSNSESSEQTAPDQKEKVMETTTSSIIRVNNGAEVEFNFSESNTPITGITFDSKNNKGLVMARVDVLKDTPDGVFSPPGTSYKLISINVGNEGTISTDSADNINIHFRVSKEWAAVNKMDTSTIRMTRYHDDQWDDLPTIHVDEDDELIYLTTQTPGFSIFSIVGFKAGERIGDEEMMLSTSEYTQEPEPETENMEVRTTPGFTIITGIVIVFIAALRNRKQK
ncbi:PGF-pre-PGF domain-containing protein [Methanolobus sp. ZRKC5]|uniref:PGF-pre-PGF domain-containing protein n=1 Tax=unclassified Methanolobus TaxID=2629569 RepID=UPI00313BB280